MKCAAPLHTYTRTRVSVLTHTRCPSLHRNIRFTNVYVKGFPPSWDDDKLREAFSGSGNVTSLCVRKVTVKDEDRAFGFVNYETSEQAVKAISEMHDKVVTDSEGVRARVQSAARSPQPVWPDSHPLCALPYAHSLTRSSPPPEQKEHKLSVQRAMSKAERERVKREAREARRRNTYQSTRGRNLYVKPLGADVDDAGLHRMFSEFGEIESAHVMTKEGSSQGFGASAVATGGQVGTHSHTHTPLPTTPKPSA